jgi:hypothetical protein
VSDQQGLSALQPQYETLMPTPVIVIGKHFRDGPDTLDLNPAFATLDRSCKDGIGGERWCGGYRGGWCDRCVADDTEIARSEDSGNEYQFFHVHRFQSKPLSVQQKQKYKQAKFTGPPGIVLSHSEARGHLATNPVSTPAGSWKGNR